MSNNTDRSVPLATFVPKVVRQPTTFMVNPILAAAMREYAKENGYTVARVIDVAIREFLEARS